MASNGWNGHRPRPSSTGWRTGATRRSGHGPRRPRPGWSRRSPRSPPGCAFVRQLLRDHRRDRGVPVRLFQGPGEHDLGHVPPDPGELDHLRGSSRVLVSSRPVAGHQLVGRPARPRNRRHAGRVVEVLVHFFADQLPAEIVIRPLEVPVEDTDIMKTIFRIAVPFVASHVAHVDERKATRRCRHPGRTAAARGTRHRAPQRCAP